MKKDAIETLIKVAVDLATRRPLHAIDELCDNQKQVSSARLYDMVELAGDDLAGYAVQIKQAVDDLNAQVEVMRSRLSGVCDYADGLLCEVNAACSYGGSTGPEVVHEDADYLAARITLQATK